MSSINVGRACEFHRLESNPVKSIADEPLLRSRRISRNPTSFRSGRRSARTLPGIHSGLLFEETGFAAWITTSVSVCDVISWY